MHRINNSNYQTWEKWLKGSNPHLLITFDSECASQHREATFITPLHPLVKQAAISTYTDKEISTCLNVKSNKIASGNYEFVIYLWRFHGIREDLILKPIASCESVTECLPILLEEAYESTTENIKDFSASIWKKIDNTHYKLWSEARYKHQQRTNELAEFRKESLATSHGARISLLEEQFNKANNEKIQKMRRSQIVSAESDYARRVQELEISIEKSDITSQLVAYGSIRVEGYN